MDVTRRVGLVGTGLVLVGLLSGCTSIPAPQKSLPARATPSVAAVITLPGATVEGSGKYVTDVAGKYETTKLRADAPALQVNDALVSKDAKRYFSNADIQSAQTYVANFIATQTLDSIALDGNAAGWKAWQKTEAAKYVNAMYVSEFNKAGTHTKGTDAVQDRSGLIFNDVNNNFPTLIRDGKPRESSLSFNFTKVYTGVNAAGRYIGFNATGKVAYRVDKPLLTEFLMNYYKETKAQVTKRLPSRGNTKPFILDLDTTLTYKVFKSKGAWGIVGYNSDYKTSIPDSDN